MSQDPLHLMCVEPRFPGRLGGVADWLVRRRGYRCWFFYQSADPPEFWPTSVNKGLELVPFGVGGVAKESSVAWTRNLERGLCYAYGCWEKLHERRPQPVDLILGHSAGLGSTLFSPVDLPRTPMVNLFHYHFHPHANDLADETGPETPIEYFHWRRAANTMDLLDLENGVVPWTHTAWQRNLFPAEYRDDFVVLPDGIETQRFASPNRGKRVPRTLVGRTLAPEVRIVTFVARSADQLRGLDRFVELANRLQRTRADVLCIVVGGSVALRGLDVLNYGQDYRRLVLQRTPVYDSERLWFFDQVRPAVVAEVLAASDLHVYPSRAYPLSRSLLEAAACACPILAWDTDPVREVFQDGNNARLVSDVDAAERAALKVLADPAEHREIGESARSHIRETFSQEVTMPPLAKWFDRLVAD